MQLIKTLSVVAIATGVAVAAPEKRQGQGWWGNGSNRWWNRPSPNASVTVDGFTPESTGAPAPAAPSAPATTTTTSVVVQVTASPSPAPAAFHGGNFGPQGNDNSQPSASPSSGGWAQPSAAPSSAPAPSTGGSGGVDDYMSVVSQWRAAGGLPPLTQDSTLEGNAAKTCADSGGQLNHELNPGTMAQVLAPGECTNPEFTSCYVGGWLCEIPSLPGLNGICGTAGQGWNHGDETGHADILTSTKYTKIGCACGSGLWACDLA